jgi:hypothetical protein
LDRFDAHAETHHGVGNRMICELIGERPQRETEPVHLVGGHAARNVEREDNGQGTRFAGPFFQLEEGNRLLDAVRKYSEIFLPQGSNRASICIKGRDVDGDEVGVEADDLVGLLLFRKYLARAVGLRRACLRR